MTRVDVYLRTCSKTSIDSKKRIVEDNREILTLKCIASLCRSISLANTYNIDCQLHVIDDHSDELYLTKLQSIFREYAVQYEIRPLLLKTGFNASAEEQFQYARLSAIEYLYLVEDDYFHTDDAIYEMVAAIKEFSLFDEFNDTAIFPFDCPDRYFRDQPRPCRILQGGNRHWRTVNKTSNTVFMHERTFRKIYKYFRMLAVGYRSEKHIEEDTSINKCWNNTVEHGGPVNLFNPIPSLAIHMSYESVPALTTKMCNWKEEWDNFILEV